MFRGRWTEEIHAEWMSNLLKNRPELLPERIQKTREHIDTAVPDCLVTGYEDLIPELALPDQGDRHVLAAAIRCQADVIVTYNRRDFPPAVLERYSIEAQHPDTFLRYQAELSQPQFLACARSVRQRLKKPPITAPEYIIDLAARELVQTASWLGDYAALI